MRHFYLVILLMIITVHCYANDAGVEGVGGSVALLRSEHSSVRMVSEKVDVKLTKNWEAKVRCTFIFKNEGTATTVMMGFPESAEGEEPKQTINDFKSWVNGKQVKTRLVRDKSSTASTYKGWHVKDVQFKEDETLTIVDTYTGGIGSDIHNEYMWFEYILKTGASWKGRIEKADISVDVSELLGARKITSILPKGYTQSEGIVKWTLRNIEPTENVCISFVSTAVVHFYEGAEVVTFHYPVDKINGTYMEEAIFLIDLLNSQEEQSSKYFMKVNDRTLVLTPGSKIAILDGKKQIELPQAPYIGPWDRLVIPLATVVRALGGTVSLDRVDGKDELSVRL